MRCRAPLSPGANRGRPTVFDRWLAGLRGLSASELHRLADASGDELQIVALDVTNLASVKAAAAELDGRVIDLLLNNAGVGGEPGAKLSEISITTWVKVLDVNTMGPLRVSEAFVGHVARSERKLIVTLTSGMGSITDNASGGAFAYRSSKAAVNMVMRSLAIDLTPLALAAWSSIPAGCKLTWVVHTRP
jgi:NAD(P)-dependent dehydrogenase (short-subunit alcohol dehydrogenase family)